MHTKIKQKNRAFTLVETLVAISIFSVSILGLMSVLASGISNTNYAKQKTMASYLAQEGIEYVRNLRDNAILYQQGAGGWNSFKGSNNKKTINYETSGDFSGFTREVWLDNDNLPTNEVKVFSKVSWNQGSGVKTIIFSEHLFNWY